MREVRPLGDLINVQSGYAFKSKDYTEDGHFLIRIGNVQDGCLTLDKPKHVALDESTYRFSLNEGDLLTSLTGNIGRVARVEKSHLPAALNQRVARLTVKDLDVLSKEYLFYFLKSDLFRYKLSSIGHGAAQQNVSPNAIKELTIPITKLSEQKRIVAILDEAFAGIDAAIANAEKNLANARELFDSYLESVFTKRGEGWEEKKLRNICNIKHGFAFKSEFFVGNSNYVVLTPGSFYETGGFRDQGKKTKYYRGDIPEGYI